jgi:hypothetical protein
LFKRRADEWYTYVVGTDLEAVVNAVQDIAIDHGKPKVPATPFKKLRAGWVLLITLDDAAKKLPIYTDIRKGWVDKLINKANTLSLTAAEKLTIQTTWVTDPVEKGRLTTELR